MAENMHKINHLAHFVTHQSKGCLPAKVQEFTTHLIMDLLAATAAGLNTPLAIAARKAAKDIYGTGASSVWFYDESLSIAGAAMANSAAASALDIDDGHRGAAGHAGAGIIPAVFAVAEANHNADEDILDAIILGYDIALRVATARPLGSFDTYASGRWVSFGVAAAVARLLQLDETQTAYAMAIAGAETPFMFPSGSSKYQGSSVKEGIPAAVVSGITGAYRANHGATGPVDLLDDQDKYTPEILLSELGEIWWITQCYLKPYACCRYMHAAIDALMQLIEPGQPIHEIIIETFPQALRLNNERAPTTLEGGQYSFYFSCALAAIHGTDALQPVMPKSLTDQKVLDLASKIKLVTSPDFSESFPASTPARVTLRQGADANAQQPRTQEVLHPLGDVANPMSINQLKHKFRQISRSTLENKQQEKIISQVLRLSTDGFSPLFETIKKR